MCEGGFLDIALRAFVWGGGRGGADNEKKVLKVNKGHVTCIETYPMILSGTKSEDGDNRLDVLVYVCVC